VTPLDVLRSIPPVCRVGHHGRRDDCSACVHDRLVADAVKRVEAVVVAAVRFVEEDSWAERDLVRAVSALRSGEGERGGG
jgi:hypothetical protein